mgnify:FL=1
MPKADWRHMKRRFRYAPAPRVDKTSWATLTFLHKGHVKPVPAGSQVGQLWHVSRGWPVYGKASHICILTAVHEDGSGELSTFRRPSRGFARHLRKRQ